MPNTQLEWAAAAALPAVHQAVQTWATVMRMQMQTQTQMQMQMQLQMQMQMGRRLAVPVQQVLQASSNRWGAFLSPPRLCPCPCARHHGTCHLCCRAGRASGGLSGSGPCEQMEGAVGSPPRAACSQQAAPAESGMAESGMGHRALVGGVDGPLRSGHVPGPPKAPSSNPPASLPTLPPIQVRAASLQQCTAAHPSMHAAVGEMQRLLLLQGAPDSGPDSRDAPPGVGTPVNQAGGGPDGRAGVSRGGSPPPEGVANGQAEGDPVPQDSQVSARESAAWPSGAPLPVCQCKRAARLQLVGVLQGSDHDSPSGDSPSGDDSTDSEMEELREENEDLREQLVDKGTEMRERLDEADAARQGLERAHAASLLAAQAAASAAQLQSAARQQRVAELEAQLAQLEAQGGAVLPAQAPPPPVLPAAVLPAEATHRIQQLLAAADQLAQKLIPGLPDTAKVDQILAIVGPGDGHLEFLSTLSSLGRDLLRRVAAAREGLLPALGDAVAREEEVGISIAEAKQALAQAEDRDSSLASQIRGYQSQIAGLERERRGTQERVRLQTFVVSRLE